MGGTFTELFLDEKQEAGLAKNRHDVVHLRRSAVMISQCGLDYPII